MKKRVWKKKAGLVLAIGTLCLNLVACGGYMNEDSATIDGNYHYSDSGMSAGAMEEGWAEESYDMVVENTMDTQATTADSTGTTRSDVTTNRKLIRTVSMEVETEDFDTMVINVEDKVDALGGYIESAYTYNGSAYYNNSRRYAEMTVRVPDEDLENFVDQVAGVSNVVSKTTTTEDITLEYVDTEGLRDMYLAEETSLLALLEKAETVEDITYLTSRLSEVRYNIENLESRLLKYDDLVEYATIHLFIEEVEVYTPVETEEKTFGEEIKEGFTASVQDIWNSIVRFVKNLIINLPYIIRFFVIVGLIILAIRLIIVIIKKAIKNKKAKKAAKSETVSQNVNKNGSAVKQAQETAAVRKTETVTEQVQKSDITDSGKPEE